MNRTLKEATVKRYHYTDLTELDAHLQAFLRAYNHAEHFKKLRGKVPHEFVCAEYAKNPNIFARDPTHELTGLYTYGVNNYISPIHPGLDSVELSK